MDVLYGGKIHSQADDLNYSFMLNNLANYCLSFNTKVGQKNQLKKTKQKNANLVFLR